MKMKSPLLLEYVQQSVAPLQSIIERGLILYGLCFQHQQGRYNPKYFTQVSEGHGTLNTNIAGQPKRNRRMYNTLNSLRLNKGPPTSPHCAENLYTID